MNYQHAQVRQVAELLKQRLPTLDHKADVLKAVELRELFEELKSLPPEQRAAFGAEVNQLRAELTKLVQQDQDEAEQLPPIDITAPFDVNTPTELRPHLLTSNYGSQHPLMTELATHLDIFYRMGFAAVESREIDDEYHMFTSLNFPEGHPARDDYDTFMTTERDRHGRQFIAPAHVSIMQNRLHRQYKPNLDKGLPIAVVYPGRAFRNEDVDARHDHTFYQIELSYIDRGINAGHLVATIKAWFSDYFQKELEVKIQPFYFPFTEPSFEFAASCIFCDKKGCNICSYSGWIELGGCGMIHPNVLHEADIDTNAYTGFAGGFGLERLVMLKYGIEDIRLFGSARLDFLRQFA